MSERTPALLVATASISAFVAPVSTGRSETTRRIGVSRPVGRRRTALPDPSAHILPTEADDHARAHGGRGIKIRWDEVVEKAVQMRQGRIEQHSGYGRGNTIAVHTMLRRRRCSQ